MRWIEIDYFINNCTLTQDRDETTSEDEYYMMYRNVTKKNRMVLKKK